MTFEKALLVLILLGLGYIFYQRYVPSVVDSFDGGASVRPQGDDGVNVVLFYADWCPHCQKVKPVWKQFKSRMDGTTVSGKTIHVQMVHCPDNETVCRTNGVSGYPTIKCFGRDQEKEYSGEKTVRKLQQWVRRVVRSW
tara:strand:+ start:20 stop:436 length:417 start_codon:yes stop_codon:yes gene_type:complete